jgi:hypothetical protein
MIHTSVIPLHYAEDTILSTVENVSYLRSVSGTLDVMEELVEVRVVTDGGRTGNDSPESHFYVYLIDKIKCY